MGTNDEAEDVKDVGPVWNARNQTPMCMVHCDEGICDFKIEIRGSSGQLLKKKRFIGVPSDGNRGLAYGGSHETINCEVKDVQGAPCIGFPREPAWVILDNRGQVEAYMTNDSDQEDEAEP